MSTWLHGAKGLIHNGCTSGLEAAVCGIPRIAYMPIRSEFRRKASQCGQLPRGVSGRASRCGQHGPGGRPSGPWVRKKRRRRLRSSRRDLRTSMDRWLPIGLWMNGSGCLRRRWKSPTTGVECVAPRSGDDMRARISTALSTVRPRLTGRLPSVSKHKYPDVTDAEMMTLIDDLRSSLGRFDSVRHERLGERSFVVRPK